MDLSPLLELGSNIRDLVADRWRQLLIAIVGVAVLNTGLWTLLIHIPTGSVDPSTSGATPDLGTIKLTLYFAVLMFWGMLVTILVAPMSAASTSLADDDDAPAGWLRSLAPNFGKQWIRLGLVTLPFMLFGLWMLHDTFSLLGQMFSTTGGGEPGGMPLSMTIGKLLFGHTLSRWGIGIVMVGVWLLWTGSQVTGVDNGILPSSPMSVARDKSFPVVVLTLASAVFLGPVLFEALGHAGKALLSSSILGESLQGGEKSASIITMGGLGLLVTVFLSAVSIPWVALFRTVEGVNFTFEANPEAPTPNAGGPTPGYAVAATQQSRAVATAQSTHAQHSIQPQAAPLAPVPGEAPRTYHDRTGVVSADAPTGWWVYLPAGTSPIVRARWSDGPALRLLGATQDGQWFALTAVDVETGTFTAPADGWFMLALQLQGAAPQSFAAQLDLPAGAQLADQAAA